MALAWERWHPHAISLVAGIVYLAIPAARQYKPPETLTDLFAAIVGISGIAVGFLATAKSILISIDDKDIVKKLKKTEYYRRIMRYLKSAIWWSFFLAIWSACALLMDIKDGWVFWKSAILCLWIILVVGSLLSSLRVIRIFFTILDTLD